MNDLLFNEELIRKMREQALIDEAVEKALANENVKKRIQEAAEKTRKQVYGQAVNFVLAKDCGEMSQEEATSYIVKLVGFPYNDVAEIVAEYYANK